MLSVAYRSHERLNIVIVRMRVLDLGRVSGVVQVAVAEAHSLRPLLVCAVSYIEPLAKSQLHSQTFIVVSSVADVSILGWSSSVSYRRGRDSSMRLTNARPLVATSRRSISVRASRMRSLASASLMHQLTRKQSASRSGYPQQSLRSPSASPSSSELRRATAGEGRAHHCRGRTLRGRTWTRGPSAPRWPG